MQSLIEAGRGPRTIVLENVYGCLTSHGGNDFAAIAGALADAQYRFGAAVIDASHFVPQSRPRVFFIAARNGETIPNSLIAESPQAPWHPAALVRAQGRIPARAMSNWLWWNIAKPATRSIGFADLIEDHPTGVRWRSAAETYYLLELMAPPNREKVAEASEIRATDRRLSLSPHAARRARGEAPARRGSLRRRRRLPAHAGGRLVAPVDSTCGRQGHSIPAVVAKRGRAAHGPKRRFPASGPIQ